VEQRREVTIRKAIARKLFLKAAVRFATATPVVEKISAARTAFAFKANARKSA
jgi:hypothetical protein